MWDVKTARYGTVLQNPALGDLDDLQEPKTDNSDAKKSANLSRVGVNDDAAATISIGAESNPVLGKHNSSVSYGTPDHITVGEELYAISTKSRSNTPKPTTNKSVIVYSRDVFHVTCNNLASLVLSGSSWLCFALPEGR